MYLCLCNFLVCLHNHISILLQTSPLLIASYYGHVKVVERLLEQDGVDVALEDYEVPEKGKTPLKCNCLVFAIINGHRFVFNDFWGVRVVCYNVEV